LLLKLLMLEGAAISWPSVRVYGMHVAISMVSLIGLVYLIDYLFYARSASCLLSGVGSVQEVLSLEVWHRGAVGTGKSNSAAEAQRRQDESVADVEGSLLARDQRSK